MVCDGSFSELYATLSLLDRQDSITGVHIMPGLGTYRIRWKMDGISSPFPIFIGTVDIDEASL